MNFEPIIKLISIKSRGKFSLFFNMLLGSMVVIFISLAIIPSVEFQKERNNYIFSNIKLLDVKLREIRQLVKERNIILDRVGLIQKLSKSKIEATQILNFFNTKLPDGVYLKKLQRKKAELHIVGVAVSLPGIVSLMHAIDASDALSNSGLKQSNKRNDGNIDFTILSKVKEPVNRKPLKVDTKSNVVKNVGITKNIDDSTYKVNAGDIDIDKFIVVASMVLFFIAVIYIYFVIVKSSTNLSKGNSLRKKISLKFDGVAITNISTWPTTLKIFVVFIVGSIVFFIMMLSVVSPEYSKFNKAVHKEFYLINELESKQHKAAYLNSYKKHINYISYHYDSVIRQLPIKYNEHNILMDISQSAMASGIVIEMINKIKPQSYEFYEQLPIQVGLIGTYNQLGSFMSELQKVPRVFTIDEFVLIADKGKSNLIKMNVSLKIFRYVSEEEYMAKHPKRKKRASR